MTNKTHTLTALALVALVCGGCVGGGGGNRPAQLLHQVGPEYPAGARANGQQGEVRVQYSIGLDGKVSNVVVVAADPPGVFDSAAVAAVRQWHYRPPVVAGEPRAADNVTSTLTFRLDEDSYQGYE